MAEKLSVALGKPITYQAIRKWQKAGRLPRTEWTGETEYAKHIAVITGGQVSETDLLPASLAA